MPQSRTAPVHEHEKAAPLVAQQEPQKGKTECEPSFPMPILPFQSTQRQDAETKNPGKNILPNLPADVKMLEEFQARHIPYDDIVATMRTAYPGFDKSLLSKCRNPRQYGVGLRPQAVKLLSEHFHIEAPEAKRQPRRTKPKRIQLRLTEELHTALQRCLADRGQTAQEFLEALVVRELEAHRKGALPPP